MVLFLNLRTLNSMFEGAIETISLAKRMNTIHQSGDKDASCIIPLGENKGLHIGSFNSALYITVEMKKEGVKQPELAFSFTIQEYTKFMSYHHDIQNILLENLEEVKLKRQAADEERATQQHVTLHSWLGIHGTLPETRRGIGYQLAVTQVDEEVRGLEGNPDCDWSIHRMEKQRLAPDMRTVANEVEGYLMRLELDIQGCDDYLGCMEDMPYAEAHTMEGGCLSTPDKLYASITRIPNHKEFEELKRRICWAMRLPDEYMRATPPQTELDRMLIICISMGYDHDILENKENDYQLLH